MFKRITFYLQTHDTVLCNATGLCIYWMRFRFLCWNAAVHPVVRLIGESSLSAVSFPNTLFGYPSNLSKSITSNYCLAHIPSYSLPKSANKLACTVVDLFPSSWNYLRACGKPPSFHYFCSEWDFMYLYAYKWRPHTVLLTMRDCTCQSALERTWLL